MSTRALLLLVGLIGGAELFVRGHLAGSAPAFHAGAWILAASLVVVTRGRTAWLRRAAEVVAGVVVALSLAELVPARVAPAPQPSFSFSASGGDPEAMKRFWDEHERERKLLRGETPLAPAQRFSLFGRDVELDSLGLRRADAPPEGAWRIVVVGDAATFGAPQNEGEQPWPEQLQREIDTGYTCARRVAVRNAGRPGRTLQSLGENYEIEVDPLAPDLLVVYPGIDAFDGLVPGDSLHSTFPVARASRWLTALERPLRERADARHLQAALAATPPPEQLKRSPAARRYRRLLLEAREHGVDVALVPVALAVAGATPEPVVRFHESVWPEARALAVANYNHARLLPLLGAAYRAEVIAPDDDLDGAGRDGFIDLVSFTQQGSERLARHVSHALAPLLKRGAGCEPRV
ncbi:MAG TPA: hypothetical protein VMW19_13505 [Myxococcota bacterium]|nr:hypothetical protein [Myxococcota bacterium]